MQIHYFKIFLGGEMISSETVGSRMVQYGGKNDFKISYWSLLLTSLTFMWKMSHIC